MTLAWHRTSQKKSQTRRPIGKRWKSGSFLDSRILWRIGPNRRQKRPPEARTIAAKSKRSQRAKYCGSANVGGERIIGEPTHNT